MKRSHILMLLITCLILAAAIAVIFFVEGPAPQKKAAAPEPTASATQTPLPTATPEPTATPSPEPTAEPTAEPTPAPTAEAVTTAAPESTAASAPATQTASSGSFRSDTENWLNLVVRWSLIPDGEKTKLRLEAYAESYSLETYKRVDDVAFTVNGTTKYDSSGPLNVDSPHALVENKLGSAVFDVESGKDVTVNVSWHFNGTYGKKDIEFIKAEQTISVP